MGTLILIRHGQSQWNLENRFTGWSDVPLTDRGRADAKTAAGSLKEFHFDVAYTSHLQRATETLEIILSTLGQSQVPLIKDSALNERYYGDLQGLNKAETATKYGQEQVTLWRRSYTTRPPNGESIEDVGYRVLPYVRWTILPQVYEGKTIIISASGNSMRPILKMFDNVDDETAATMEVGLCTPYIYTFDKEKLVQREVRQVPGIVTKGASQTESNVQEGRV
ncbi:2,3-bisphosphoglycerate-dependent phosphoglycerate mutase [Candidatus Peribacteria bacterium]|nr:2,3-bisphosphoglycerate-dependent phosphoglycerate mutase [Candidatus Peribacteria bacterium]